MTPAPLRCSALPLKNDAGSAERVNNLRHLVSDPVVSSTKLDAVAKADVAQRMADEAARVAAAKRMEAKEARANADRLEAAYAKALVRAPAGVKTTIVRACSEKENDSPSFGSGDTRWSWIANTAWKEGAAVEYTVAAGPGCDKGDFTVTKWLWGKRRREVAVFIDWRRCRLVYGRTGKWYAKEASPSTIIWADVASDCTRNIWVRLRDCEHPKGKRGAHEENNRAYPDRTPPKGSTQNAELAESPTPRCWIDAGAAIRADAVWAKHVQPECQRGQSHNRPSFCTKHGPCSRARRV